MEMKPPEFHSPPRIAAWLVKRLERYQVNHALSDDMEEVFRRTSREAGHIPACLWYWGQCLDAVIKDALFDFGWRIIMLQNYLKTAIRSLQRQKAYSTINVTGLAVGLVCCMLILLWVRDELSYDRFHENADRIFRVVCSTSDDGLPTNANGSFGVGPLLKKDFPEVLETVRFRKMEQNPRVYVGHKDKKFYESRFLISEPAVFTVFNFPLVRGDSASALLEPNSIVLTEDTARKYFGSEDPLGKMIEADAYNDGNLMLFRVTGIAKNVPRNSHLHFDFLASYSSQREDTSRISGFYQNFTYVLLDSPRSAAQLNNKLLDFLHRNWTKKPWFTISLQPLLDIRLRSRLKSEIESNGSILYVYVYTAVAAFVLVIACINFMNLTTARASRRAREVGIRKVVGARKNQLVQQFLGESILLGLLSALGAVLFVIMALPVFNRLTGKSLTYISLADPSFLIGSGVVILAVGLISGIYPAFFLSAFPPARTLKQRTATSASGAFLRKGLVIFQFALSTGIILATIVVQGQMTYIRTRNLGYDRKQIVVIPLNKDLRRNYEGFRNELLKYAGIENVATSDYVPTRGSAHYNFRFEGQEEDLAQVVYLVDKEFVDTYGLKVLAGKTIQRPLSAEGPAELLVSELTTREAGYSSPQEAVGKILGFEEYKGQIAGVVNDMNIYSLHQPPYSISYVVTSIRSHKYLSLRIAPQNMAETLAYLRTTWQKMIPGYPLDYFFLDASFEQMHLSDKKMSEVFSIFSILAIFVACLGLFGLAVYTVVQRTKEIGVRKILGASTSNIYLLLSREFLTWVVLANIVAWPAAYYVMNKWLQSFAFRISIGWEMFLISAGVALLISMLTVAYQSVKAALANPADSLRYE
jgi:putative ABC transport system permease protein